MKQMQNAWKVVGIVALILIGCETQKIQHWPQHDLNRPQPKVVAPGAQDYLAPSDAIVLFDTSSIRFLPVAYRVGYALRGDR
jgi:hypothetical protein